MSDLAPSVAAFLRSPEGARIADAAALRGVLASRWPNLIRDEMRRGFAIAAETARAEAAEHHADADGLDAIAQAKQGKPDANS